MNTPILNPDLLRLDPETDVKQIKPEMTKPKIIQTAIDMFNQEGVAAVGLEDIALGAGIDLSEILTFYPEKSNLMYSVYRFMRKTLEKMLFGNRIFEGRLEGMDVLKSYFEHQLQFRFFYKDQLHILRTYPEIRKAHQEQLKQEINIIKSLNQYAVQGGYLLAERVEGQHDGLAHHIWILINYWIHQQELRGEVQYSVTKGIFSFGYFIFPYLTEKGKEAYSEEEKRLREANE